MAIQWTTSQSRDRGHGNQNRGGDRGRGNEGRGHGGGPELLLPLERGAGEPLRSQLEQGLRVAIRRGRLKPGTRLPSSRALATDLGISRGLVVEAYAQLAGEGYLEARQGSGTRVAGQAGRAVRLAGAGELGVGPTRGDPAGGEQAGNGPALGVPAGGGLAGKGRAGGAPAGGGPPRLEGHRTGSPRIDFRPGAVDPVSFPRSAWAAALRRVTLQAPAPALGYPDPRGARELRDGLAAYLGRVRGVDTEPAGVLVVSGFAQGLTLLARTLPSRYGRSVALEDPGSPGQLDLLARTGLDLVPIAVDDEGLRVDQLRASGARVVMVTPAHQFPSGVVLGPRRRAELLDWAASHDGLIVEDDYDAEFRYDREPMGALQGLAPDLVVYAGSLSKTLAPALRLGWLVPPAGLLAPLAEAKHDADLGSPTLDQLAFADLLASGAYDRHLRAGRARHRRHRDALVRALASHAPDLRVRGTAAGLHAVVELPPGTDEEALVRRAARAGVGLHRLGGFHMAGRAPAPGLVLGYGSLSEGEISAGVRLLAELLDS
jgi:GntR family transcriptional regulator/MocR family aminotransferase